MHGLAIQVNGQGYGMPRQYGTGLGKDHFRENVRRMRQIQRMSKEKEAESVQPVKALWKSEKYKDISSKIKDDIQVQLVRHDFDFIKLNGRAVKHPHVPRAPSLTALDDLKKKQEDEFKKHKKGEVPTYLRARKDQWKKEEEDRIANTPDPSCPEGHRVLPEAERRETLDLLKNKQQELISKLQSLPLRTDTFRMRSCKQELENKLAEMEEAIKIFSRPKVFVK
ncbi:enkurin domain-containing protein 1-like isoform X2 [Ruditapes philippinarum]|uniref:enkurin domain-containing protein 1-like isoform X2 n=1 Tax=Ruditapes philippinarum TaxID=129788 RepID=UPI00295AFFAD|nr:enkurin domain-containing protein 1-like isoform X2 [Ruditapes philippinarum]